VNALFAALFVAALIALPARTVLGQWYPAARHRHRVPREPRPAGGDAEAWLDSMRPGQSLAGLRLRRDLRRWLPDGRNQP
jgi:hypothetical protein